MYWLSELHQRINGEYACIITESRCGAENEKCSTRTKYHTMRFHLTFLEHQHTRLHLLCLVFQHCGWRFYFFFSLVSVYSHRRFSVLLYIGFMLFIYLCDSKSLISIYSGVYMVNYTYSNVSIATKTTHKMNAKQYAYIPVNGCYIRIKQNGISNSEEKKENK